MSSTPQIMRPCDGRRAVVSGIRQGLPVTIDTLTLDGKAQLLTSLFKVTTALKQTRLVMAVIENLLVNQ
jgi:hypothetical protein